MTNSFGLATVVAIRRSRHALDTRHVTHSIVARPSKCLSSLTLLQFVMPIYRQIDRQYIPLTEGGRR